MRTIASALVFCVAITVILFGNEWGEDCSCADMSSTACLQWGSNGSSFYWTTYSNPGSSITLI